MMRLRDSDCGVGTIESSAKQKWLQIPRQRDDAYVSSREESVRVLTDVRALDEDDNKLKVRCEEDGSGGAEIGIETWKESLRKQ
jgi:hypothetical protein